MQLIAAWRRLMPHRVSGTATESQAFSIVPAAHAGAPAAMQQPVSGGGSDVDVVVVVPGPATHWALRQVVPDAVTCSEQTEPGGQMPPGHAVHATGATQLQT